jgi:hypothetical protein
MFAVMMVPALLMRHRRLLHTPRIQHVAPRLGSMVALVARELCGCYCLLDMFLGQIVIISVTHVTGRAFILGFADMMGAV